MPSRIWNGKTGQVEYEPSFHGADFEAPPWQFGDVQGNAPSAPAIADFLGVPVKWVLIAGIVLVVLPYIFKRAK